MRIRRYKLQANELRYVFTPSAFYAAADMQPGVLRLVLRVHAKQEGFATSVRRLCSAHSACTLNP